nr:MAG TPA: hypothetical protein [Caudoviricetes sp.]
MVAISPSVKSLSPESLRASVVRESPTCLANARIETPSLLIRCLSSVCSAFTVSLLSGVAHLWAACK